MTRLFKIVGGVILSGLCVLIIAGFIAASVSRDGEAPGLTASGTLTPCPTSPNCVVSFSSSDLNPVPGTDTHAVAHYAIDPITFAQGTEAVLMISALKDAMADLDATLVAETDRYLAFAVETAFFGFVDDIEFLIEGPIVYVRSASRVGYGDGGANRKRVETVRTMVLNN